LPCSAPLKATGTENPQALYWSLGLFLRLEWFFMKRGDKAPEPETDPRFPSGPWIGFWIQKNFPAGKHSMELQLFFCEGKITGEGRDWVGAFTVTGRYELSSGVCHWIKQYVRRHAVAYKGFNEGKGIWGKWEIASHGLHGGFHIWPEGLSDPTGTQLHEAADVPSDVYETVADRELQPLGSP
jgi:hypothetical protein